MKKWLFFAVVCCLAIGSAFLGRDLGHKKHVAHVVDEILSSPQVPIQNIAMPTSAVPKAAVPSAKYKTHTANEQNILQVRKILNIKKYESISLKESQRPSYKKVFMAVATDPKADWLMQRQALRNLYKQNIPLSDEDRQLLLTRTDQRALENYQQDDKELLTEAMQSL